MYYVGVIILWREKIKKKDGHFTDLNLTKLSYDKNKNGVLVLVFLKFEETSCLEEVPHEFVKKYSHRTKSHESTYWNIHNGFDPKLGKACLMCI